MFYVYILGLSNGKHYIGQTNNIHGRLYRHETGQVQSTKGFRPVKMLYFEKYNSRSDAIIREKYLKSLKSHKHVSRIIDKNLGHPDKSGQ